MALLLWGWFAFGTLLAQATSDSLLIRYFQEEGIPVTSHNRVRLLTSGHDKFVDLFQAIRQARHHIHLEYFNFRNDSIANATFDLLALKAEEGVEVRAMFDAFGNWSNNQPLKKEHLEDISRRGIEIVKFDPMTFPYVNHALNRDHRKIVVIDGKIGYTGGMNIADYYIHGLPEIGPWRDMHMHIEGEAVRYLQGIFLNMWNRETGQHVGGPAYFPDSPSDSMAGDSVGQDTCGFHHTIAIVDRVPRETPRSIRQAYVEAINTAQHDIQIVNPYFTPTRSIRKAIRQALKRGVEVEIMVPTLSDIPFTPDVAAYHVNQLRKKGAKVYFFDGGFHHSKIMMVDHQYCTVGTANLNSRSLRYDYETNAFIFAPDVTHQLNEMFEEDKLNSTVLTRETWKQRSAWKRFVGWFGRAFTPFL